MRPPDDFDPALQALEDNYELMRELGGTNATVVYLARVRASGRLVALKMVRPQFLRDPEVAARFSREARTLSSLEHPNVVRTIAVEQLGDRTIAIVMEYLEGGTLRELLRSHGALSFDHARAILHDLGSALQHSHERGIVHRDVKPENIFIEAESGRALLSDFGIAREIEADTRLTLAGSAVGTPTYMSPEQIDGQEADARSDLYSLGVMGWELVTGLRPWDGETLYGVIYNQKHEDLPPILSLRADTPASLREAIEGAMRKREADRWPTAAAFLTRLGDVDADAFGRAAESASDDLPTLHFRRPDETMRGVPLADVARAAETHRTTLPIEREVSLQPVREPGSEVAQEPEVRRPRLTQPRRKLNGDAPIPDIDVTAANSAAIAAAAAAQMANDADETPAPVESENRRDALRISANAVLDDSAPTLVPPPRRRNPLMIAVPSAIALIAALFLLARRESNADERVALSGDDSLVTSASGGSVAPTVGRRGPASPVAPVRTRSTTATPTRSTSPARASIAVPRVAEDVPSVGRQPREAKPSSAVPALPESPVVASPVVKRDTADPQDSPPLNDRIADNDVELNRVYQQLVNALRRGASGEAETADLRAQQRAWLLRRDATCRAGTIDERATCFREQSQRRSTELSRQLDAARSQPDSARPDTARPRR